MEEIILISYLNDFIFCPASIYFHKLYGGMEKTLYQTSYQINGTDAHKAVDNKNYSTKKEVLQGIDVYTEKYNILGKIDIFDINSGILIERKKKVLQIYDGYIFQTYAQYYGLQEMGYEVKRIKIHSIDDNKNYDIKLPEEDEEMKQKFINLITSINNFNIENFKQDNVHKCEKCIYEPSCDRSMLC